MYEMVYQVVAGDENHERKVRATCKTGIHLTDGQSNLRESATESRPPSGEDERVR